MKKIKLLLSIAAIALITNLHAQTYSYNFAESLEGWAGSFADYPVEKTSADYQLEFARTLLPAPLNTSKHALRISGFNHSDDLFMYIKKKITGLVPNKTYQLKFDITLASNAPTNAVGVGGAPGQSVFLKAGATIKEPTGIVSDGYYRMNIDKNNQSKPGTDMDTIGHIGVADDTKDFTLIKRSNAMRLFTIKADSNGEVWVCIGTDSGFESKTTLYYDQITLTFLNVLAFEDPYNSMDITIFPNPASEKIEVKATAGLEGQSYAIVDHLGKTVVSGQFTSTITSIQMNELSNGKYLLRLGDYKTYPINVVKK